MSLINCRNRALAGLRARLLNYPRIFSVYNQTVRSVHDSFGSSTDSGVAYATAVSARDKALTRSSFPTRACDTTNDHVFAYYYSPHRQYHNSRHSTEYYSRNRDRHHDPSDHSNHPHLYAHSPRPAGRAPALPRSFPSSAFDHLSAPAVVGSGRTASYRDLLAHAARLAREFRKRLSRVEPRAPHVADQHEAAESVERGGISEGARAAGNGAGEARAEQQGGEAEAAEGPRIAIFGRPGTDYVAGMWAAWAAGGVAVPLCDSYPADELLYVLKDSGARLVVGPESSRPILAPLAADVAAEFVPSDPLEGRELEERDTAEERAGVEAMKNVPFSHAAALIVYTSGTTGQPKGVVHSHIGLASQASMLVDAWDFSPSDRVLNVLPLHHVHGIMNALLSPLSAGATVEFLPDHRFDAAAVWQRWRESYPDGRCAQPDSITFFTGVPTHYVRLLQEFDRMPLQLQRRSALAASKLRLMMCGSASCPEELMRRWQQVTGQRLLERYGMTEFAMALTNPLLGEKKPQSVGVPLRGVKVKLADIAKARPGSSTSGGSAGSSAARGVLGHVPAPGAFSRSIGSGSGGGSSGSTSGGSSGGINSGSSTTSSGSWSGGWGELLVKSPGMFLRYWNKPKETAEAFDPEGWFRTGDIASVDSHGYWQIHGRESVDIIKTRGYKVSALEIESKLLEHPLVSEAVVLGVPDREQGEAVAAVVVLGSTLPHHQNHHRTNHQQQQQQYQQQHVDSAPGSSHGEVKNEGEEGTGVADSSETASGGHPMLTLDELRKWASTRVAGYKVPSRLRVVDKMPRNVMGKVNKKDLLRDLFPRLQQS